MYTDDEPLMSCLYGGIASRLGLELEEESWPDLSRRLDAARVELGLPSLHALAQRLTTLSAPQLATLASHLTIGETYFFRYPRSYARLEHEILPALAVRRDRPLRLWSAGCSSGEEAYSLAMVCMRVLPPERYSILATDVNQVYLDKAARGIYRPWSFRGTSDEVRERFFTPVAENRHKIADRVRATVQLVPVNLVSSEFPSETNGTADVDVIFCRNVLMYLTRAHQEQVVAAFHRCLSDGGCLFVAAAEAGHALYSDYVINQRDGVTIYHKGFVPPASPGDASLSPRVLTPAASPLPLRASSPVARGTLRRKPPVHAPETSDHAGSASPSPVPPTRVSDPDEPRVQLELARKRADEGQLEEALRLCEAAIEGNRTNPEAHFLCARVHQELGQVERAIDALRRVLYLDRRCVVSHHALATLYQRAGRRGAAKRHGRVARRVLASRPPDELPARAGGLSCGQLLESLHPGVAT